MNQGDYACQIFTNRLAPAKLALGQVATLSSSHFLHRLREERAHDAKIIGITTKAVTTGEAQLCVPISLNALMSFAAVLGIARCLPYELPSLLAIPYDIDPHAHMKGVHQSISTKDGLDTYGGALQCNTIKVPLMLYSNDVRRPNVLARHQQHASYIITGKREEQA